MQSIVFYIIYVRVLYSVLSLYIVAFVLRYLFHFNFNSFAISNRSYAVSFAVIDVLNMRWQSALSSVFDALLGA